MKREEIWLPVAMLTSGAVGAILLWPLGSLLLSLTVGILLSLLPMQAMRARQRQRTSALIAAIGPTLVRLARICQVRCHPLPSLIDLLPMIEPPLQEELAQALAEAQAGLPLPDALRRMAKRTGDIFYLHQLAELVALHIRFGGDLSGSLQRLASRIQTMEELRAEEAAELFGYQWLTRLFYGASLLPLVYWAITNPDRLRQTLQQPLWLILILWTILSGVIIIALPGWMALDD